MYRGTSLIRNHPCPETYRRPMPRVLGGGSYEPGNRGTLLIKRKSPPTDRRKSKGIGLLKDSKGGVFFSARYPRTSFRSFRF